MQGIKVEESLELKDKLWIANYLNIEQPVAQTCIQTNEGITNREKAYLDRGRQPPCKTTQLPYDHRSCLWSCVIIPSLNYIN